jgi:hypothetical protein
MVAGYVAPNDRLRRLRVGRRQFLLGLGAGTLLSACAPPAPRPTPPLAVIPADQRAAWEQEAHAVLSDAIDTLRTFDILIAFRSSRGRDTGPELTWDPPPTSDWQEATHVTTGMRGRADRLLQAIGNASVDAAAWRERRDVAAAADDLLDLADALGTCRERVEAGGDEGETIRLLDATWARWDQVASGWNVTRAEAIACSS